MDHPNVALTQRQGYQCEHRFSPDMAVLLAAALVHTALQP